MAKNVGGAAAKRELTLHEIQELQDHAFEMGVKAGREAELALAKLKSPVICPHCLALERIDELERREQIREHSTSSRWHA